MGTERTELISRSEFVTRRWRYRPGEHVTFLGPTGRGKTTLAFQLLERTARRQLPAVVLAMKPRDTTVSKWTKRMGFQIARQWPPAPNLLRPNPPGWTLWPRHRFDPNIDNPHLWEVFRRAILDSYKRGNRILVVDEMWGIASELGLSNELITVWSRGRSMKCGLWGGTQKPTHVPLWAYSQAEHLFLANDPDERARKRFDEIGGVDPRVVSSIVMSLRKYQWLYLRREDGARCIVDA